MDDQSQVKGQTTQLIHNVQFPPDSIRKGSLCNVWRPVCRRLPRDVCEEVQESVCMPKCLPACRVGVRVNLCESNHVAQRLCECVGGRQ